MNEVKLYIGLDVHKDSIAIAFARAHSRDDPQFVGTTRYSVISLARALSRLGKPSEATATKRDRVDTDLCGRCASGATRAKSRRYRGSPGGPPTESRPIVATRYRLPSFIVRVNWRPIVIPEPQDEAIRDLVRAREDAVDDQRRVRQRLKSFLLRHGHAYTGTRWGAKARTLSLYHNVRGSRPAYRLYRVPDGGAICHRLVERLTQSLRTHAESWRWLPMVKGLMTLCSIDFTPRLRSSLNSTICGAYRTRANSWATWDSCRRSTPAETRNSEAG